MNVQLGIKVLIVDDHPAVRMGLSAIIRYEDDLNLVGQAADAAEAIELFKTKSPDVTLVDLSLPDMGGIELITMLRSGAPTAKFIVLTANAGGSEISKALHAGAHAYLFKNAPFEELLMAIRTVFGGGRYMSGEVCRRADEAATLPELTPRELQVLSWIVKGHSNAQIAEEISIGEETVKFHVKNILAKLGVSSRSKAGALALQVGLMTADSS